MTRYVSPSGLDTNAGTSISAPWKTITKAANSALPGDLVYIRNGTYAEMVTLRISGTDPNGTASPKGYITFQSYPGESAIIDGSTLIPVANDSIAPPAASQPEPMMSASIPIKKPAQETRLLSAFMA